MNVAIIGANGFIGSHLTAKLSETAGVQLFLFDKTPGISSDKFPSAHLDLLDRQQVEHCFSGIDIVYYLASATIPSTSWENPAMELDRNLLPFISFMESISGLGIKKVVFISSAGTIYGTSNAKVNENSEKAPYSPHGIIKLTMEYFLNYFKIKYNINSDIYRISNVYGEGQNTANGLGLINTLIENTVSNKPTPVFGNGTSVRNYVYIKDAVELLSYSLTSNPAQSNTFNIASNDTVSINELIDLLKTVTGHEVNVLKEKERGSDNPVIDVDNTKIREAYPDFRFTPIHEGIGKTYAHIKKQHSVTNDHNRD
jgi:UDP-glucose 4-epimerase